MTGTNLDLALVVFTDVDACLIDRDTYSPGASAAALQALHDRRVPLVLCSSKTCEELESLREQLDLAHPFIAENGAAVYVPDGYFPFHVPGSLVKERYHAVVFGRPRDEVAGALERAARDVNAQVLSFSRMDVRQIAADTGLTEEAAALAQRRQYDEPFRVTGPDTDARDRLVRALGAAGIRVIAGGRYDHALADADKGLATSFVRRLYRKACGPITTVGLGDGLNDVPLLRSVDLPVIVRSASDEATARVQREVPWARTTRSVGPEGWNEAVLETLGQRIRVWDSGSGQ